MSVAQEFSTNFSVIDDMFAAIEAGDMEALRRTKAPGVRVWHNYDEHAMNLDEVVAQLGHFASVTSTRKYQDRRITTVGNQAFLQHTLTASLHDGRTLRIPAMMRVVVDSTGLVEWIDEYFDSASMALLAGAPSS